MSSLIEKLFKAQQARFGKDEKTLINSLAKKQDPWPNGIVKNALSITIKIVNGFKCFVVQDKHHEPNDNRIVFIHGGAYVGEISQIHWFYIRNLIKKTNAKIYVPIYPLTTNEYSGQLDSIDFLVNLYKQITENEPNKIYHIFGDSAGGNLGLILAQQIKMNNYKHPQNLILFSPVLSMEDTVTAEVLAKNDPILPYDMLKTLINWQLQKNDPKNPLFSPLYGDSNNVGNIHIFVGANEFFLYFVKLYCTHLDKEGIKYYLDIKKGMYHDYPIFMIENAAKETNKKVYDIINGKFIE